jgi:hypothetical protein
VIVATDPLPPVQTAAVIAATITAAAIRQFCDRCGTRVDADDRFCGSCGNTL